ncbi:unnamed protein product, partial [Mesorhabditis spiculigera]
MPTFANVVKGGAAAAAEPPQPASTKIAPALEKAIEKPVVTQPEPSPPDDLLPDSVLVVSKHQRRAQRALQKKQEQQERQQQKAQPKKPLTQPRRDPVQDGEKLRDEKEKEEKTQSSASQLEAASEDLALDSPVLLPAPLPTVNAWFKEAQKTETVVADEGKEATPLPDAKEKEVTTEEPPKAPENTEWPTLGDELADEKTTIETSPSSEGVSKKSPDEAGSKKPGKGNWKKVEIEVEYRKPETRRNTHSLNTRAEKKLSTNDVHEGESGKKDSTTVTNASATETNRSAPKHNTGATPQNYRAPPQGKGTGYGAYQVANNNNRYQPRNNYVPKKMSDAERRALGPLPGWEEIQDCEPDTDYMGMMDAQYNKYYQKAVGPPYDVGHHPNDPALEAIRHAKQHMATFGCRPPFPPAPHYPVAQPIYYPQPYPMYPPMVPVPSPQTPVFYNQMPYSPVHTPVLFSPMVSPTIDVGALRKQLEYYFTNDNLQQDFWLRRHMNTDGYVPIGMIMQFPRVRHMTQDPRIIVRVLRESDKVEVDDAGERVRPVENPEAWPLPPGVNGPDTKEGQPAAGRKNSLRIRNKKPDIFSTSPVRKPDRKPELKPGELLCPFCQKQAIKKNSAGIWKCNGCQRESCSGDYFANEERQRTISTSSGKAIKH